MAIYEVIIASFEIPGTFLGIVINVSNEPAITEKYAQKFNLQVRMQIHVLTAHKVRCSNQERIVLCHPGSSRRATFCYEEASFF